MPRRALGMSVSYWKWLGICMCAIALTFAAYVMFTDCNVVKHELNSLAAKRHIGSIAMDVLNKPGRETISMGQYVGDTCGSIAVQGEIADALSAENLRADIAETNPPVEVIFQLANELGKPIKLTKIPAH